MMEALACSSKIITTKMYRRPQPRCLRPLQPQLLLLLQPQLQPQHQLQLRRLQPPQQQICRKKITTMESWYSLQKSQKQVLILSSTFAFQSTKALQQKDCKSIYKISSPRSSPK